MNTVPKYIFIKIIRVYQKIFSPDNGFLKLLYPNNKGHCCMYPTCSEYTVISIQKYGVLSGTYRGIKRILRCNPFQKQFVDIP